MSLKEFLSHQLDTEKIVEYMQPYSSLSSLSLSDKVELAQYFYFLYYSNSLILNSVIKK